MSNREFINGEGFTMTVYFMTPAEHHRALCDAAIRAVEQLAERLKCDQSTEQELAFVELTMRRIRRELP